MGRALGIRWVLVFSLILPLWAQAQSVEVDDGGSPAQQDTGNARADQYFKSRKNKKSAQTASEADGSVPPRYLALQVGTFFADQYYNWANGQNNIHNLNAAVTYRLGEWVNSMDLCLRGEYTNYVFDTDSAQKLSLGPLITFPDAKSRFPLYFGAGAGIGLFIQQVPDRSPVALDWQVVGGVRLLNLFQRMGLVVETGLKNHILLASPGQFNGVFIDVGTVFVF